MTQIDDRERAGTSEERSAWSVLGLSALGMLVIIVLLAWPGRADGAGTFDECYWGYPVVALDGTTPALPVMEWPVGLTYDYDRQVVLDASGQTVVSTGERVVVHGKVRDLHGGDIPPCFASRGIEIESIAPG
jgi:hypothetical protein